jgi:hypothetical protein
LDVVRFLAPNPARGCARDRVSPPNLRNHFILENEPAPVEKSSKSGTQVEALKSTSIIGGSTVIVMLVRIVRTKVLALLLGPTGIGLEGIFDSALNVAKTAVDLGISNSGVRQIAAAVSSAHLPGPGAGRRRRVFPRP